MKRHEKHIFGTVKVGEKGQVVIPKKARDIFGIQPGDLLLVLGDESQGGLAMLKSDAIMDFAQAIMEAASNPKEADTEEE